jgi:hypothetical protein
MVSKKRNNLLLRGLRPGPEGIAAVHETWRPLKWPLEDLGRTGSVSPWLWSSESIMATITESS